MAAPNLETLVLVGYYLDNVTETGDDEKDVSARNGGPFEKSAALLLRMPETYINGQDRVEAFWRTLIVDSTVDGRTPSHEEWGPAFREYLMVYNSVFLLKAQKQGDQQYRIATQRMEPLLALAKSTPEATSLIPSLEETLQRKDIYAYLEETRKKAAACRLGRLSDEREDASFDEMQQNMVRIEEKGFPYGRQLNNTLVTRRLFRTDNGLLGLGPRSLQTGDHVFVLLGARVPFVLRPIQLVGGSRNRYEMVGEAYIHGIMQGEALDRGELSKMEIEIV